MTADGAEGTLSTNVCTDLSDLLTAFRHFAKQLMELGVTRAGLLEHLILVHEALQAERESEVAE